MAQEQSAALIDIAYREAGHAVMSYLIRGGFTDKFVPIDRSLILPPFQRVAIEGSTGDWGGITKGLGSLLTAPQVLLAGLAVQQIRGTPVTQQTLRSDKMAEHAFDLFGSYIEEYEDPGIVERDRKAGEWVDEAFSYVVEQLQTYWAAVEKLAQTLLELKGLSEPRAFEVIEQAIPADVRAQAKARVEDSSRNYTQNVMKMLYEANPEAFEEAFKRKREREQSAPPEKPAAPKSATSKPVSPKPPTKKWWEFWK